jgi:xylan 1,4-beta-xylosidase
MLLHERRVVASLVAFLVASATCRASAQTVTVSVDATAPGTPLERIWAYHGYDEVNYTTTPAGTALLGALGSIDISPQHIRNHFLLNNGNGAPSFKWGSTNVYSLDAAGNPAYDWTLMEGILDAITSVRSYPYVEIGFMPHDLSVHPDPYQNSGVYTLDGGCFYPPKDYGKWASLIAAWAAHSNARYPNVSSTWQWELWNEPDLGYWHGTEAEYEKLYDYTEAALHSVLPSAPLGGPATASQGAWLAEFLQHCVNGSNAMTGGSGTRLDFVSFHAKGGAAIVGGHVELNLGNQLTLHKNGFEVVAGFPQFQQTPIVVSEADPDGCAACPLSSSPQDAYRLSPAYGAYEVAMMKHTLELEGRLGVTVRGLDTWAFLFDGQPYFAGYRVLSTNGIHLPVLNAFKLLGQLAGSRVPLSSTGALGLDAILANSVRQLPDVDGMATFDGQNVRILVWNYHDDLVPAPATPVHLTVTLPASFGPRAIVTRLGVDDDHGDAYTTWLGQGSPAAPSAAQLAQLRQDMEPAALQPPEAVDVTGNTVSIDFDLPREGLSLVTVAPQISEDASAGDDGATGSQGSSNGSALGGGSGGGASGRSGGCGCRLTDGPEGTDHATGVGLGLAAVLWLRRRRAALLSARLAM